MSKTAKDYRAEGFFDGYQEAMLDLQEALDRGGYDEMVDWLRNNTRREPRSSLTASLVEDGA